MGGFSAGSGGQICVWAGARTQRARLTEGVDTQVKCQGERQVSVLSGERCEQETCTLGVATTQVLSEEDEGEWWGEDRAMTMRRPGDI